MLGQGIDALLHGGHLEAVAGYGGLYHLFTETKFILKNLQGYQKFVKLFVKNKSFYGFSVFNTLHGI